MAKVYAAPLDPPAWGEYEVGGRFNLQKMNEVDADYIARLATICSTPVSKIAGKVIRFQVADGYAQYMVWRGSPLELIHLNLHDGYAIPEAHARGLNLFDIKKMVELT